MKKISFLLLSALTLLFTACTESKFEMHQTFFYPQHPDGMRFYADQTYDSIKVHSFDPWTAQIEADSEWFTISPTSSEARPGTSALTRIDIRMAENTTGKNHKGYIRVKSYDNISMPIYQSAWLNILSPAGKTTGDTYEDQTIKFSRDGISATEKKVTITFHVYQDGAKLVSNQPWITFSPAEFNKGQHSVDLQLQPNESKDKREAVLTLTSGQISTPIYLSQEGKKDEN